MGRPRTTWIRTVETERNELVRVPGTKLNMLPETKGTGKSAL